MVKNTLVAKRMLTDQQIREFLQIEKEPLVWESYIATEMDESNSPDKERCFYVNAFASEGGVTIWTTVFYRHPENNESPPSLETVPVKPLVFLGTDVEVGRQVSKYVDSLLNYTLVSDVSTREVIKQKVLDYIWDDLTLKGRTSVVI